MNTLTDKRLIQALAEAEMICFANDIPTREVTRVFINNRLTSTWGRCRHLGGGKFEIEISKRLMAEGAETGLLDTMLHELLHTCEGCMNHGSLWKSYAARLNKKGFTIYRCNTAEAKGVPEREMNYKYRVTCNNCGDVWNYTKRGAVVRSLQRNPKSCKCGCGSRDFTLEIL